MDWVKLKLSRASTEHHAMKAYWGSWGIAPRILDLGTRLRSMVSFTPRSLYPRWKSLWYPLDRRLGGPQSRSGRGGEEKNSQPLQGLDPPIVQLVAQRYTDHSYRLPMKVIGCTVFARISCAKTERKISVYNVGIFMFVFFFCVVLYIQGILPAVCSC
jgi:hypothetical protein